MAPTTPTSRAALIAAQSASMAGIPLEAPAVTPVKSFFMRVSENDVHRDYDGGRIILSFIQDRQPEPLHGGQFTLIFGTDTELWEWPAFRNDMQETIYKITVEECTLADLPVPSST